MFGFQSMLISEERLVQTSLVKRSVCSNVWISDSALAKGHKNIFFYTKQPSLVICLESEQRGCV